ncbi:protein adenylyltransferase SelO [Cochlodiniinecator piscidefendens]|uniref:protein adenylyltransferase SelO n=1 Tax=Cochlodiniinecator piscidefendens TaxID=2715756 RepID=UPI00140B2499|nr:YdiU family protein [Cochlodiniinecator piscidefendens]
MTLLTIPFDNSFAQLSEAFYQRQRATPVRDPGVLALNLPLAAELGISGLETPHATAALTGNAQIEGADPIAQAYAGHQFGNFVPQLGDGRAVLLGEVIDRNGKRHDIQLKGSGPTPFSRNGDGRAWLGPVLREYVVSEAMHALGIPTTRALAAMTTGETVQRETGLPGAVLTRVASSHIRVGTFQYFAARKNELALQQLTDYTLARHYPDRSGPLGLLQGVIERQADLIAKWLGVGFIHGVMNTDNCHIAGETIDYGPCAFMDRFHPATVFSSIDRQGRYAYQNQPDIAVWNIAQLATSLLPIIDPDQDKAVEAAKEALDAFSPRFTAAWQDVFRAKLGLTEKEDGDTNLILDLMTLMANEQADFTNTFRALGGGQEADQFANPEAWSIWKTAWTHRLTNEQATTADQHALRQRSNPAFIPRNHRIEQMIQAAVDGDKAPFERLMSALATPYKNQPDAKDLQNPPNPDEEVLRTFCGT